MQRNAKKMLYRPELKNTALLLYVMALWPDLLSGLDREIALAWSKAQWVSTGYCPRLFLEYEIIIATTCV